MHGNGRHFRLRYTELPWIEIRDNNNFPEGILYPTGNAYLWSEEASPDGHRLLPIRHIHVRLARTGFHHCWRKNSWQTKVKCRIRMQWRQGSVFRVAVKVNRWWLVVVWNCMGLEFANRLVCLLYLGIWLRFSSLTCKSGMLVKLRVRLGFFLLPSLTRFHISLCNILTSLLNLY